MKMEIKTIDLTPTWSAIVLVLAECHANGSQIAREELLRLAAIADLAVERQKFEAEKHLAESRKDNHK
jgi:hypothetical protein